MKKYMSMVVLSLICGIGYAAENRLLAEFDFSNGLAASTTAVGVASAELISTDYSESVADKDPSDGVIDDNSFLVSNGILYMKRGSASWGFRNPEGPFEIRVTASDEHDVRVESLSVELLIEAGGFRNQQLVVRFGSLSGLKVVHGESVQLNTGRRSAIITLKEPVLINAGQSARFCIDFNSGDMDSSHLLNSISVQGTVREKLQVDLSCILDEFFYPQNSKHI
jgi:hypothetical protein